MPWVSAEHPHCLIFRVEAGIEMYFQHMPLRHKCPCGYMEVRSNVPVWGYQNFAQKDLTT